MAKLSENERSEAYKIYMSDALVLINTCLTRGEVEIPRYADMFKAEEKEEPQPTTDQVYARFDKLRRKRGKAE